MSESSRRDGHEQLVRVSGGRPDLARPMLDLVRAPTLLIVGGRGDVVIGLNEEALARLRCEKRLEIVPGAMRLFEEPGALERVAGLVRASPGLDRACGAALGGGVMHAPTAR